MHTKPKKATKHENPERTPVEPAAVASATIERALPETFDTDEEPHGRGQLGAPHTHDDVDDEVASEADVTDVQTGFYGRRGDGEAT